eukprot:UN02933
MLQLGQSARMAASELAYAEPQIKNSALREIAQVLDQDRDFILRENSKDLELAASNNIDKAMLERLELNSDRIDAMIDGLHQVANLSDPVGEISELSYRPQEYK